MEEEEEVVEGLAEAVVVGEWVMVDLCWMCCLHQDWIRTHLPIFLIRSPSFTFLLSQYSEVEAVVDEVVEGLPVTKVLLQRLLVSFFLVGCWKLL